jgi:hypothetical protein
MSNLDGTVTKIDESLASSSTAKRTNALHHLLSELVVSSKASTLISAKLNQSLAAAATHFENVHAARLNALETQIGALNNDVIELKSKPAGGAPIPSVPAPSASTKLLSDAQLTCLRALHAFEAIYLDAQLDKGNSTEELARMKESSQYQLVTDATGLMAKSSAADRWRQLLMRDKNPHEEKNRSTKLRLIHALREAVLSDDFPTTT